MHDEGQTNRHCLQRTGFIPDLCKFGLLHAILQDQEETGFVPGGGNDGADHATELGCTASLSTASSDLECKQLSGKFVSFARATGCTGPLPIPALTKNTAAINPAPDGPGESAR